MTLLTIVTTTPASNASLPNAEVGVAYAAQMQATGGTAPYSWSMSVTPNSYWLSITRLGNLTGTPKLIESDQVTVTVTDSASNVASVTLPLSVLQAPATISSTTIPAYLYTQYADDDDLAAFIIAYNQASQYYLNWFATVALPYYPGLTDGLLTWVANGLYGQSAVQVAVPAVPALGPLNTQVLNYTGSSGALDGYAFGTNTYYLPSSADILKRIITWNFYKGDGKRFSIRWLKRRIMRFLAGTNGIDPQPGVAGYTVGTENTQAIGVVVSGGVLTVTINYPLLNAQVVLAPNVLLFFQLAFEEGPPPTGPLDLPMQYTSFVVNIAATLTATVSPTSFNLLSGSSAPVTAPAVVTITGGGSGSYTYAWTWSSGGTPPTITSPSSASTTFSASGLSVGQTVTGVAQCVITDTITSGTVTLFVPVSLSRAAAVAAAIAPSSINAMVIAASYTSGAATVSASGGVAPYAYAWSWQSGGAGIAINTPTSPSSTFTASGLSPGLSDSGTAQCVVTDSIGQTVTVTLPVTISYATAVSASVLPSTQSLAVATAAYVTGPSTVTASGGSGSYTYAWSWFVGGANLSITSPTSPSTTFMGYAMATGSTYTGTARCVITDAYGQTAVVNVSVALQRVMGIAVSVSPANQTIVGENPTIVTGISTVAASGGMAPYSYAWSLVAGSNPSLTINIPFAASTGFTGSSLAPGGTYTGTAQCVVTDALGQTSSPVNVTLSVTYATAISASVSPATQSVLNSLPTETTGVSTVTASGGSGAYTYAWSWVPGQSPNLSINFPTSLSTTFTGASLAPGGTYTGTAQCVITDGYGQTQTVYVPVSVTRITSVTAAESVAAISNTGAVPNLVVGSVTTTASGGVGPYTYSWIWNSGGTNISILSPTSAATQFEGVSMLSGGNYTGVAQCTVTDSYGQTAAIYVTVSVSRISAVSGAESTGSVSTTVATATSAAFGLVTMTASGGSGSYTFAWSWSSGGTDINILSPGTASTTFQGFSLAPGNTYSGIAQCVATDGYGQTATIFVNVSVTRVTLVTASVAPTTENVTGGPPTLSTGTSIISASGGQPPYFYGWAWAPGASPQLSINSPSTAATNFTGAALTAGNTYSGTAVGVVVDSLGQSSNAVTVGVTLTTLTGYSGTLTSSGASGGGSSNVYAGYIAGSIGAISPTTDGNGNTVTGLYTETTTIGFAVIYTSWLTIAGPNNSAYFTTLTVNGVNYPASSAIYSYSGGVQTWLFSATTFPISTGVAFSYY